MYSDGHGVLYLLDPRYFGGRMHHRTQTGVANFIGLDYPYARGGGGG